MEAKTFRGLVPLTLATMTLCLSGCLSLDTPEATRGSLSGAMGKAANSNPDMRHVNDNSDDSDNTDDEPITPPPPPCHERPVLGEHCVHQTIVGGDSLSSQPPCNHADTLGTEEGLPMEASFYATLGGTYSSGASGGYGGGMMLGTADFTTINEHFYGVKVGFEHSNLNANRPQSKSIRGGYNFVDLDFSYRKYFNPDYTFAGIYLPINAGARLLAWKYRYPLIDDNNGGASINGDSIWGLDINTGLGFAPMDLRHIAIGGEMLLGVTIWNGATNRNFSNDYFSPFSYARFSLFFSVK